MPKAKGVYHYKIAKGGDGFKATPFGEMAEGMEAVTAATMPEVETACYKAALKLSGFPEINYYSAAVTPKSWLWTACIGTQMGA